MTSKQTIARWQTRGGRRWIELHSDAHGFSYRSDHGGGNLGDVSLETALASIESRVNSASLIDGINMKRKA